jgi:hypothetical protein
MFRHTIEQMTKSQAFIDATAAVLLLGAAILPLVTFASVTLA